MSVQASNLSGNAKMLQDHLLCPVLQKPLTEAVSLIPCAHKVQQTVAEQTFGTAYGAWIIPSNKPCPVCRVPVVGYMADQSMRYVVKQLLELPGNDINMMLTTVRNNLVNKSQIAGAVNLMDANYPGKPAKFFYIEGVRTVSSKEYRSMRFISSLGDSLIKEFGFIEYSCGWEMYVAFSKDALDAIEYFKEFGVSFDTIDSAYRHCSTNVEQVKIIFKIISENNEISASNIKLIKKLIDDESFSCGEKYFVS